jgi:hypothetical protein
MEVNPIKSAVESFGAVNDIFRQDAATERQTRMDDEQRQQRQFENDRQTAMDARSQAEAQRAQETHQKQMTLFQNQQDVANDRAVHYKLSTDPSTMTPVDWEHAKKDPVIADLIANPEKADERLGAAKRLHNNIPQLLSPDLPDSPERDKVRTEVFDDLVKSDPERFKGMKIVGITPSPQHKGFAVEVEKEIPLLDQSGKPQVKDGKPVMQKVVRVLTENGKTVEEDPNDPVKFYTIDGVMGGVLQNAKVINGIKTALAADMIKKGDTKTYDAAISSEDSKELGKALDEGMAKWDDSKTREQNYAAIKTGMLKTGKPVAVVDKVVDDLMKIKEPKAAGKPQIHETGTGRPGETQLSAITTNDDGSVSAIPIPGTKKVPKPEKDSTARDERKDKIDSRKEINLGAKDHERAVNAYYKSVSLDQKIGGASEETRLLLDEANKAADAQTVRIAAHNKYYGEVYTGGGAVVPQNVARRQGGGQQTKPRTNDPDLNTAKAYIQKYGSKEAAMSAWHRGE